MVFKYIAATAPPGHAQAYVNTVRLIHDLNDGLFPRLIDHGTNHIVEEHVPGRALFELDPSDWAKTDLPGLFARIRQVSTADLDGVLTPREIQASLVHFVTKALRPPVRATPWARVGAMRRLLRNAAGISDLIRNVMVAANGVEVPRTYMIDDVGPNNVLLLEDGRLVIVEADYMRSGFWGFDGAWLLSTLGSFHCPPELLETAYADLCDDTSLGFHGGGTLVSNLLAVLLEIRCHCRDSKPPGVLLRFRHHVVADAARRLVGVTASRSAAVRSP